MVIQSRFVVSRFFFDIPEAFIDCARVIYPWNSTEYTLKVTSVLPQVFLITKMEELIIRFKELQIDIKDDFDSLLDNKDVGERVLYKPDP